MPKSQHKYYMLGLVSCVTVFSYLDRSVMSLLLELIKHDLMLSDSQLGLLNGFAFAFFYAVAGVPIARWADRGNRNIIISAATILWSSMLVLMSVVTGFAQLLLVRVSVAVGEAGCLPPAVSLISDNFDRDERPRAMGIYWLSSPIAAIIAYLGGGWLAEAVGWRTTFLMIGVSGVFIAVLVKLTLREPRLEGRASIITTELPPLNKVLKTLWHQGTFRYLVIAYSLGTFFGAGIGVWIPSFFMRSHGVSTAELGVWLALVWGLGGIVGSYLGGFFATRFAAGNEALQMRVVAMGMMICSGLFIFCFLSSNKFLSFALMASFSLIFHMFFGPVFAAFQSLVSDDMRASSLAIVYMFSNFIGLGVGPLAVGMVSDMLSPMFGLEALRYALVFFSPGYFWAAYYFWISSKTIGADIMRIEQEKEPRGDDIIEENFIPSFSAPKTKARIGFNDVYPSE